MPQQKIYYSSPIGILQIVASPKGICSVQKVNAVKDASNSEGTSLLLECKDQLIEYFERKRTRFDLPLDWQNATPFNINVWKALLAIPYGQTRSYSDIARQIEHPTAVRAVGLANRHNPIAIIVPCHRVIGKNGNLTGYFYGIEVKRQLLALENPQSFGTQGALF